MGVRVRAAVASLIGLLISFEAFPQDSPAAKDQAVGEQGYPRIMSASEIQAFYGAREMTLEYEGRKGGTVSIRTRPDGTILGTRTGEGAGRIGMAAAKHAQSSGTWKVDAGQNKICHEWNDTAWTNTCFFLRQPGPNSHEYAPSRDGPGMALKVK